MTAAEKLSQVKSLMNITGTDFDAQLAVFLSFAQSEILNWIYSGKTPDGITDVPARYESVQVMAVVVGYSQSGNEGQLSGIENGISRTWEYSNMVSYVRQHVYPYVEVV